MNIDSSGNLVATGNISAYSDARLKDNVVKIDNALEKIKQINGYTYTRNDIDDKTTRFAGVLAQELQKVLPEVVHKNDDGYLSVSYGNIISLLIEAIKELEARL